ncbi:MAG: TetR/AcrR family transcriptional regulator [Pseudomonadota bacterium]
MHQTEALSKSRRTELRLVQAVRDEFAIAGGFSAAAVARRTGMSPATFYNHFPGKDEALLAAYVAMLDELVALVDEHCRIERLLALGLSGFFRDWLQAGIAFFAQNVALLRAGQVAMARSRPLREAYRHHEQAVLDRYQQLLQLGQAARVIRAGDSAAMSRVLLVQTESWYHPMVLRLEPRDELFHELAESYRRLLAAPTVAQEVQ